MIICLAMPLNRPCESTTVQRVLYRLSGEIRLYMHEKAKSILSLWFYQENNFSFSTHCTLPCLRVSLTLKRSRFLHTKRCVRMGVAMANILDVSVSCVFDCGIELFQHLKDFEWSFQNTPLTSNVFFAVHRYSHASSELCIQFTRSFQALLQFSDANHFAFSRTGQRIFRRARWRKHF